MVELEWKEIVVKDAEWVAAYAHSSNWGPLSAALCYVASGHQLIAWVKHVGRDWSPNTHVEMTRVGDEVIGNRRWDDMVMHADAPTLAPPQRPPSRLSAVLFHPTRPTISRTPRPRNNILQNMNLSLPG